MKEYSAIGLYEEENRSLFYRKALGLRRFYEHCDIPAYHGKPLFPSGKILTWVKENDIIALSVPFFGFDSTKGLLSLEYANGSVTLAQDDGPFVILQDFGKAIGERLVAQGDESYIFHTRREPNTAFHISFPLK